MVGSVMDLREGGLFNSDFMKLITTICIIDSSYQERLVQEQRVLPGRPVGVDQPWEPTTVLDYDFHTEGVRCSQQSDDNTRCLPEL